MSETARSCTNTVHTTDKCKSSFPSRVDNIGLQICNAENPASKHATAAEVSQFFPTRNLYDQETDRFKNVRSEEEKGEERGKWLLVLSLFNRGRITYNYEEEECSFVNGGRV